MNELDLLFDVVTIGCTGAAFVVFFFYMGQRREPGPETSTDFGMVFGAFLAGWLATELFEVLTDPIAQETGRLVHFMLLLALAAWLNARLMTVLRQARTEDSNPKSHRTARPQAPARNREPGT
ncbi:MAG TPA: hypothetical protein VI893_05190 [Thermoplasmata archaeon]|nr:hypothetical protein [Thermoplasmata archaeon]